MEIKKDGNNEEENKKYKQNKPKRTEIQKEKQRAGKRNTIHSKPIKGKGKTKDKKKA